MAKDVTGLPVFDDHVHLRRDGDHVEAAKRYKQAGGTHFMLVHSPHDDFDGDRPKWREAFMRTVEDAKNVREETGLGCWAVVGPYPVHLLRMSKTIGLEEAKEEIVKGAEEAARFVDEGLAVGIGEVGRLHFEVPPEVQEAANEALHEVLKIAKQAQCAVQLHTESADPEVMRDLAERAKRAGMPLDRTIKHYSAPLVQEEENHGLFPSVIASRRHVREAAQGSPDGRFFLETDYIDDRSRPGAVLPIETVPKRITGFVQSGDLSEEQVHKIAVDWVEKVYGVETGF